jgi:hypothetical protein
MNIGLSRCNSLDNHNAVGLVLEDWDRISRRRASIEKAKRLLDYNPPNAIRNRLKESARVVCRELGEYKDGF